MQTSAVPAPTADRAPAAHTVQIVGPTGWNPADGPPGWGFPPHRPQPPQSPPAQPSRGLSPYGLPARHSWEIPLLVIVIVCTVLVYPYAVFELVRGTDNVYLSVLALAPVLVWFFRGSTLASARVYGVKMSPTQFPEGHRMVQEAAARFGMKKAPDAYVQLGNGQINAFAAGHGFRRFVVVYSDLFEIGGAARDPEALAFILGHEVGHIAAGHASYWRQFGSILMNYIPILGPGLSRAQEYTADNHGYAYSHTGTAGAMSTLAAGKYLNALVGYDEMADRAATETGFFVWLTNAQASHPVQTWRMWALRDRSRHGKLFLRPAPRQPHPARSPMPAR
ncbi:M48 family metallopeptidase [Nocardia jejuensis]|uniref:M48 family metallopeptidase n=1 Tax=Nocardia jejuensis TaxID=328049 RepID=UPI0009FF6006|nr:M48 family metallopeptidase [Nocardia jejuensis]